jgi:hypothetical protein
MSASDFVAIPRGRQLLALTGEAAAAAGRWIVRIERLPLCIELERRVALPM